MFFISSLIIFLHLLHHTKQTLILPYGSDNGDNILAPADDYSYEVELSKPIIFWDEVSRSTLYVSTNGGIFPSFFTSTNPSRSWQSFPVHSLLSYFSDSTFLLCSKSCNLYERTIISDHDVGVLNNLLQKYDNNFIVDRERTLVVTWYNAKSYFSTLQSTFQSIVTSNGTTSYVLYGYDELGYYPDDYSTPTRFPKMGYKKTSSDYCELPESQSGTTTVYPRKLSCRSNVKQPGVFVMGLTGNAQFQCGTENSLAYDCSHCSGEETWLHSACIAIYLPLCGTDGRTYSNRCFLSLETCRTNGSTVLLYDGVCAAVQSSPLSSKMSTKMSSKMDSTMSSMSSLVILKPSSSMSYLSVSTKMSSTYSSYQAVQYSPMSSNMSTKISSKMGSTMSSMSSLAVQSSPMSSKMSTKMSSKMDSTMSSMSSLASLQPTASSAWPGVTSTRSSNNITTTSGPYTTPAVDNSAVITWLNNMTRVTSNTVTVFWSYNGSYADLIHFEIRNLGTDSIIIVTRFSNFYTITNLSPSTFYIILIRAVTFNGTGNWFHQFFTTTNNITNFNNTGNVLYPYGISYGDIRLPRCDDCSYNYPLRGEMMLFSQLASTIRISINGQFYFTNTQGSTTGQLDLYAFDLDTRTSGDIYYRETTDPDILRQINNDTSRLYNSLNFMATRALIISYIEVPQYQSPASVHTFQGVVATNEEITYAILNYEKLNYSYASTRSIEGGCGIIEFSTSSSFKPILATTSNIGIPGRHVYQLTNLDCFKPISGATIFSTSTSASFSGSSVLTLYNLIIPSNVLGSIDIGVTELSSSYPLYPRSIFIKSIGVSRQEYSIFSASPTSFYVPYFIDQLIVFGGTTGTPNFQFGKVTLDSIPMETYCDFVGFSMPMADKPSVKTTVDILEGSNDELRQTHCWIRGHIERNGFNICCRQAYLFSGSTNVTVHYLAVVAKPFSLTYANATTFDNSTTFSTNTSSTNYTELFKEHGTFYLPQTRTSDCVTFPFKYIYTNNRRPQVFITPMTSNDNLNNLPVLAWLGQISSRSVEVCAKSGADSASMYNTDISISYMVSGEISKCTQFVCPSHLECKLDYYGQPYCGCISQCFNNNATVYCGTDFVNYNSQCDIDQRFCFKYGSNTTSNVTIAYQGKCQQYPYQNGIAQLDSVPGVPVVFCKYIELSKLLFHPSFPVKVQLSVSWNSDGDRNTNTTHDATAVWSENVSIRGFNACVLVAGRHYFGLQGSNPYVHWLAYQEALFNTYAFIGQTYEFPTWYTGGRCSPIFYLPYSVPSPKVFVSVEHGRKQSYENAMSVWIEYVSSYAAKFCLRELQNFDGVHDDIKVHVLVLLNESSTNIYTESKSAWFGSQYLSDSRRIPGMCQTLLSNNTYVEQPTVFVSALKAVNDYSVFSNYGFTTWIEKSSNSSVEVCYESIQNSNYLDPLEMHIAVFPKFCGDGWDYVAGSCYIKILSDQCSFVSAQQACSFYDASLPVIETPGEEYYISQMTNNQAWIGLTNQLNTGDWVWINGLKLTYENWLVNNGTVVGENKNCAVFGARVSAWQAVSCNSICAETLCEKQRVV